MPRHLIGDAHEWINETPTVPIHFLAKLQPSQRSWVNVLMFILSSFIRQQRGKKTLLSLTLICYCHLVGMVKIVRGSIFQFIVIYDHETPLLIDLADLLY